jgi:carboxymethylenebutenolidase
MEEALAQGAKRFEIVTYPGAGHGFFNSLRSGWHETSARDAWKRTLAFLDETFDRSPGE